ncbi:MAG: hypothetical protein ACRECX_00695 [Methyloceanibacter sp.]|uniref:hypothetical protein n=1 Tax=Methyloceanibacter sp. TaxID=1965321 RepID=UPI003D6C9B8E
MLKRLFILLVPVALAGCVTEQAPMLPMALAPSEAAEARCLTYAGAPAFGDCETQAAAQSAEN